MRDYDKRPLYVIVDGRSCGDKLWITGPSQPITFVSALDIPRPLAGIRGSRKYVELAREWRSVVDRGATEMTRRIDNFTDNFGSGVKQAALNVGRFGSTATIGLFLPQLSAC